MASNDLPRVDLPWPPRAPAATHAGRLVTAARRLWRWLPWVVMVAAAAVALAVGSVRASTPNLSQRVTAIASGVRCPVCQGETAAQSDTPPSVEIRSFIRQSLQQGQGAGQIRSELVTHYGAGILEQPPAAGVGLWVWALPGLAVVAALCGLVWAFVRWRRRLRSTAAPTAEDRELVARAMGAEG
jgi:cytochrome c-type biogenesis protein CcmH